ncbi:MAG: MFS transporter [Bryobacteraceae bacterium]|nr:MFS transporter [Bryobacteraceae bacterium]MDW8377699.1 MFS transporter [Bryobacterales bacterium]
MQHADQPRSSQLAPGLASQAQNSSFPSPLPPLLEQIRWRILALLFLVTVMNFVDRQSLSVVAPLLTQSLGLSNSDYGHIVAAFQAGMMLGEFPMGILMDRKGVRWGLSFAVLWWSLANALHAFATFKWQFMALRFWLGSGECGNYSGGNKVVSEWFPVKERALAVGIFNSGSMVGSVVAQPLLAFLILTLGWQSAFLAPSMVGALWVLFWWRNYREPADHPRLSSAERQYIFGDQPLGLAPPARNWDLLRFRQTWGLMLCRMLVGPVVQFYIYWLPLYLFRVHHFDLKQIGMFAWLPWLFGDLGSIGGGWVAGLLLRRGCSLTATRRITMMIGAALCLGSLAVATSSSPSTALGWICAVLFGHTFLSANMFATISDTFPQNAVGRVTALTGIAGGLSGMGFPVLAGKLIDRISYEPVFVLAALMPALGCLILFVLLGPIRPIALPAGKPHAS